MDSLQQLVDMVAEAETAKLAAIDHHRRLSWELTRAMEADGATEAVSDSHVASLEPKSKYDPNLLHTVLEFVPEEELVDSGAYVPEHQTTVPAAWNATRLKPFGKRGSAIKKVIESARIEQDPRLKVSCIRDACSLEEHGLAYK